MRLMSAIEISRHSRRSEGEDSRVLKMWERPFPSLLTDAETPPLLITIYETLRFEPNDTSQFVGEQRCSGRCCISLPLEAAVPAALVETDPARSELG